MVELNIAADAIRILVVDDEEILRRHMARHLEKAGYRCVTAADAVEARRHLADDAFEVVLCDVNMPGESGLDLVRYISDTYPDTTTLMVSGIDDTEIARFAIEVGATGYVVKPVERNELLINVANALNQRALMMENRRHRHRLEELVELQSNYDLLTGLANRQNLNRRLELSIAAGDTTDRPAVLFFDLDHFRVINDSLGHEAGDTVLKEVGRRVTAQLAEQDLAARFGSDSFVVLLAHADEPVAIEFAERLQDTLVEPHLVSGRELVASASIGIVTDVMGYPNADTVLRDADAAMNQAKAAGRAGYRVVDEAVRARARKRLDIETGLREAIESEQLSVHYQPQFDVDSGDLIGFEALARWHHPELGMVLPGEFIPVAEETGLIIPMGRWVLEQSCRDLIEFRERSGDDRLTVAVNVSPAQLMRGPLVDDVVKALTDTGLPRNALCIEITESVLLQGVTQAIRVLRALKALGVRISVDDFGTGYSSLSYIGRLPIDELKIDRSFVIALDDESGAALVRGIISLAKALGHSVVAEGIETEQQLEQLRIDSCDIAQGYLLGRPAPADEVVALLAARRHAAR